MNNDSTHSNKPQESHKSINADMYNMEGVQFALYEQSKNGKNFNNLAKLVMRTENIVMAYKNVKANKGAKTPGTDGLTIDDVKATDPVIIQELLEMLKLNKEQLKKLNKLREMYGTKEITS